MILLVAAGCALAACAVAARELAGRPRGATVLQRLEGYGRWRPEQQGSAALRRATDAVWRVVPGLDRAGAAARLHAAGLDGRCVDRVLAAKLGVAAAAAALAATSLSGRPTAAVLFAPLAAAAGFVVPDVVLGGRARRRLARMLAELPGALDLVAVIVQAGLGIDAALHRYATHASGPLADEIRLLVGELRIGAREEAFQRFVARVPSPETKAFARAVVYTDRLGVSLGASLQAQAADARYRSQTAAEERAGKAPVKMLFPTVLCIFPCLLVVTLGPPLMQLVSSL